MDDHKPPEMACSIEDVKNFVHQNADRPIYRAQLANMMGYSVPHFHRIFTAAVGETITAYIRRTRLERAASKLVTGSVDLTQIASEAGYQSHAAFSKAFKRYHNYTPLQFRKLKFIADSQPSQEAKPGEAGMQFIPNLTFNGSCREALTFTLTCSWGTWRVLALGC